MFPEQKAGSVSAGLAAPSATWESRHRRGAECPEEVPMHIAKRLILAALVLCAGLVPASGAVAAGAGAGAVSFTQTFKNVTEVSTDVNPCTGAPGTLTLTYNGVFHVTQLTSGIGAGTFWATGTQTGTFTFVPFDASQPTYTGRFTAWFGDNDNLRNDAETSTLRVRGIGSDGSVLRFHVVEHMSVSASGVTLTFEKPTCG
jgi:hypothetical protein